MGRQKHKRTAIDIGLALITPIVGQEFLDRYELRDPLNRSLKYGVKHVFSAAGASTRQFKRIQGLGKAPTRLKAIGADYFDLTPDDEQKLILETVEEFAEEILRPAARDADDAASYPPDLIAKAAELGITAVNIPEDFDGIAAHRSTVTNALAAEPEVSVWDLAALDIVVREAGGAFTDLSGREGPHGGNVVATNGPLHEAVLNRLNGG